MSHDYRMQDSSRCGMECKTAGAVYLRIQPCVGSQEGQKCGAICYTMRQSRRCVPEEFNPLLEVKRDRSAVPFAIQCNRAAAVYLKNSALCWKSRGTVVMVLPLMRFSFSSALRASSLVWRCFCAASLRDASHAGLPYNQFECM